MRLTTKGRFAVTAMIDLALHSADGPVTLAGISERQKISLSYLEQLFGKLRRNKLVIKTIFLPAALGRIYRLIHGEDNIYYGHFTHWFCQAIAAAGSSDAAHQLVAPQFAEQLFQIR